MRSTVTPAGILSLPLALLAQLVAASPTFQALCGAGSAGVALANVYFPEADDTLDANGNPNGPRPRAIIRPGPGWETEKVAVDTWLDSGNLLMSFEVDCAPDDPSTRLIWPSGYWPTGLWPGGYWPDGTGQPIKNIADELLTFTNTAGLIVGDMRDLAAEYSGPTANTTYLNAISFKLVDGPGPCNATAEDGAYFYGVEYLVGWQG